MAETVAYQVVARRYRPQRFADLVGQEHVARGLSGAITSGRIGHAYLFTGARGVGKTSAARIFAKALECEAGPAAEPCDACAACRGIAAGQDVDVVEIDAASNRGIDEIRQLRQNVGVRPARGRFKTYIIDEVHMLTREAFNALLKTLEEPPAHVKFVLCTTEPEKLPITILSRCQRFDFTTVDVPAIVRRLEQIVAAEGADVSADALALVARRAAGSMRDSQSLLEQLLGAASGPVTVDDVHALIGTGREERVGVLVAAIAARDAAGALAALDAALQGGADPGGVLEQLLAAFRDALLASVGCGPELLAAGAGLGVDLPALGRDLGTATILAMLQIVEQALSRMRTSAHAGVLAEMAVVRLARLEDLESLAGAIDRVAAGAAVPGAVAAAADPAAGREKKTTDLTPPRPAAVAGGADTAASPPAAAVPAAAASPATPAPAVQAAPPAPPAPAAERGPVSPPADPFAAWQAAAEEVGGLAVDFAATARGATWREDVLEVALPAGSATAAAFLQRAEVAAALGRALAAAVGRPVRLRIVVDAAADGDARDASPAARPAAVSQARLMRGATEHPLVAHVRQVFDAAIVRVEPPRPPEAAPPRPAAVETAPEPAAEAAADPEPEAALAGDDDG